MKKLILIFTFLIALVSVSNSTYALVDYQDPSIIADCTNGSNTIDINKKICVMIRLHEKAILQKDTKVGSCWGKYYIEWPSTTDSEKKFELQLWFLSNKDTICKPIYKKQDDMMNYIGMLIDEIRKKTKITTWYAYIIKVGMFSYKFWRDMNNELEKMIANYSAFIGSGFDRATMIQKGVIWDMQKRYLSQMVVNLESNTELKKYDPQLKKLYSCYLTTSANKPSSKSAINPKLPLLNCLKEFKELTWYKFQ